MRWPLDVTLVTSGSPGRATGRVAESESESPGVAVTMQDL